MPMLLVGLILGVLLAVLLPEAWDGLREAVSDATREVFLEPAMIVVAIAIALIVIAVLASDTAKTAIAVVVIGLAALWLADRVTIQADEGGAPEVGLIDVDNAGPVEMARTTLEGATAMFGRPDANNIVRRGCLQVRHARWGDHLTIYFGKGPKGVAQEVRVRERTIGSAGEGRILIRTHKGLRVGDPAARVRELYPEAQRIRFADKSLWVLEIDRLKGRLHAVTDNGRVDTLANAPYRYC